MIKLTKTWLYTTYLAIFVIVLSGAMLFNGCQEKSENQEFQLTGDTIADGAKLVQIYCTKCHQLAAPNSLTKDVWKFHTLPVMSSFLGLSTYGVEYFKKNVADTSGISLANWQAILAYYNKLAPAIPEAAKPPSPLLNDWAGFTLRKPAPGKDIAYTTMVAADPTTHKIYSSDVVSSKLYEWDKNLQMRTVAQLPSAAVNASFTKDDKNLNQGIFSCIGQLLPMDFPDGKVVKVDLDGTAAIAKPAVISSELSRPVQSISGDFNKDGLIDWVICAQGNKAGGVYLLTQKPDHSFNQSNISNQAGSVQALVGDFNKDGWPDLMVLFGTGDEGLWLFTNDQKGGFTSRNLLRFPPVYGSTSFQLIDMNHDGKPDLIYTCGYNFRDSRIMKPYHGLYIFTNQGDWNFKQTYFYPIDGCTKAIATDFDGDGDIDIATIAFFADLKNKPAEGFIYFEQDKPMSFKPHAVPVSSYGRWMSMDTIGNGHGRPDIVLGNYSTGFPIQVDLKPFWNKYIPLIVLENHTKK